MAVRIDPRSRLQFAPLAKVNGTEFWDLTVIPTFEPQSDDVLYQWDELDRIEDLANRFYNDQRMWFVIARRNGLKDLPFSLKTGDFIYIPSQRYVFDVVFSPKNIAG